MGEPTKEKELAARAAAVLPNLTHFSTQQYDQGEYPQWFKSGDGAHIWDVNGKRFIDYMCAFGPISLGYQDVDVEAAVAAQLKEGTCLAGPSERMVELAELLVEVTPWADFAMFQKNGSDATTLAVRLARGQTRKKYLLKQAGTYHGATHMWMGGRGVLKEEQAYQLTYNYNDLQSVKKAVEQAGDDLACIIVPAYRWDFFHDLEVPTKEFAEGLRHICDEKGAMLILDDMRSYPKFSVKGTWDVLAPGVYPDLTAYGKGIANGYSLAAVLGNNKTRPTAEKLPSTGSYWANAAPMAAGIATIKKMRDSDSLKNLEAAGIGLREGMQAQAAKYGLSISYSGPVQTPLLIFDADKKAEPVAAMKELPKWPRIRMWCEEASKHGARFHPFHHWYLCAAHTMDDIKETLRATDAAFAKVAANFGGDSPTDSPAVGIKANL